MDFEIVKTETPHGIRYELRDKHGCHRVCGEYTNHPYIMVDDGEKPVKIKLLHCHRVALKRIMED